ncbi:hypothetical protein F4777DRAFT_581075 [Nemania sp. FL0916]|nr:hypothetical protein F4777DRAFT_581075 [Nemania sp. FL0916]
MSAHHDLFAVVIAGLVVNSLAVILRIWIRISKRSFGYDDAVLFASFIAYVVSGALTLTTLHYGYGVSSVQPWFDEQASRHYWFAAQPSYVFAGGLVKASIALVLLRIEIRKPIRIFIIIIAINNSLWALGVALLYFFQCHPLSLLWGVGEGTCLPWQPIANTLIASSTVDIITQWLLSLLPIVMLWNLQMSTRDKIPILVLFGLGITGSIALAIRFKYLVATLRHTTTDGHAAENDLVVVLWSYLAMSLDLLAAALVASGDVLKKVINMAAMNLKSMRATSSELLNGSRRVSFQVHENGSSESPSHATHKSEIPVTSSEDSVVLTHMDR